jgi:pimeloyl-ACP methyl ester carboxylesterase
MKGFGLSDKPQDGHYSVADQAEMIQSFIEKNGLEQVILVGNSFGGAVTLFTCMGYLESKNPIDKMILIDALGLRQRMPDYIAALRKAPLNWILAHLIPAQISTRAVLERAYFDQSKIPDESVQIYASYLKLPGARYALVQTVEQLIPPNLDEQVRKYREINIPVLLIWGEEDRVIPLSKGEMLTSLLPNSTLVVLPNCGHIPQEECPQETIVVMDKFLNTEL